MFASLFPTLFLLIVAMFVINYDLECFVNLGIAYIYHSVHQLFEYKLCSTGAFRDSGAGAGLGNF